MVSHLVAVAIFAIFMTTADAQNVTEVRFGFNVTLEETFFPFHDFYSKFNGAGISGQTARINYADGLYWGELFNIDYNSTITQRIRVELIRRDKIGFVETIVCASSFNIDELLEVGSGVTKDCDSAGQYFIRSG